LSREYCGTRPLCSGGWRGPILRTAWKSPAAPLEGWIEDVVIFLWLGPELSPDSVIQHTIRINVNTLRVKCYRWWCVRWVNITATIRFVIYQWSNGNRTYLTELFVFLQDPRCIRQVTDADLPRDTQVDTRGWPNPRWFHVLYVGSIDMWFQCE